ncbi:FAD-dependent monooxygenase [Streptomyces boncukensis]|uniref:FAD-dependent monooxygenase n=1 Tax=Streptomyces boncukensis TaxID=2711219 RepID=UPI0030B9FDF8
MTEVTETHTDVCVVGGGPAGLTLALLLLRSGARVAVVEKLRSLEREYRGEILQPGGQALLEALGVLDGARARGCHEHDRFLLEERGRILINGDYRRLPGPFNCLLSIPQRHLLAELLDQCSAHPGFRYLGSSRCSALIEDTRQRVRGILGHGPDGELMVRARCVVGADGRYSKVRRLARLEYDRVDAFDQDVLWFKLPGEGALPADVRIFRAGGSPVLAYTSHPGSVQLGWTLPHRRYRDLAARGLDHIKSRLRAAVPEYAERIDAGIASFRDLSLLDVFSGTARTWTRPGLLLIGDSAHTHGPIGAQGINLAIQDAVAAHPALLSALADGDGDADGDGTGPLERYARDRRRDVRQIMKLQAVQGKMMLSTGGLAAAVRPRAAAVVSRTPVYRAVLGRLAYGNRSIAVRTDLFRPPASAGSGNLAG